MSMTEHQRVVRAEFGRLKGVTPDDARERADALEQAAEEVSSRTRADALQEKAAALREWAVDESDSGDREAESSKAESKARKTKSTPDAWSRGTKRARKVAARNVIDRPVAGVTDAVDSAGVTFWRIIGITVVLVLVYRALTFSESTVGALAMVERGVRWMVYPKPAFPEKWQQSAAAKPPAAKRRMLTQV